MPSYSAIRTTPKSLQLVLLALFVSVVSPMVVANHSPSVGADGLVDLSLAVSTDKTRVAVDDEVTYTLVITNPDTEEAAYNLSLAVELPSKMELVSLPDNCSGTRTILCTLDAIWRTKNGVTRTESIEIKARATDAGSTVLTASVTAADPDPHTSDNSAHVSVPVTNHRASLTCKISLFIGIDLADCVSFAQNSNNSQSGIKEKFNPGHYMLVTLGADKHTFDVIFDKPQFIGVEERWTWRELEPQKGIYDFSDIDEAVDYLAKHDKQLVIQILDTSFGCGRDPAIPEYMMSDPAYEGGAIYKGDGTCKWYPNRWLDSMTDRYEALIAALAKRYDTNPNIEAIVGTETAFGSCKDKMETSSFNVEDYYDQLIRRMDIDVAHFVETNVIMYQNFFPCGKGSHYNPLLTEHARQIGHGLGGPDTLLNHENLLDMVYLPQASLKSIVPLGTAVQGGQYERTWPDGSLITPLEIADFAKNVIKRDYIFWLKKSPYFLDSVVGATVEVPLI